MRRLPHETRDEIEEEVRQHERMMRVGWWLVFVWAVLVPVGVAILEWWSDLLGLVVLLYAFFKAGRLALRLTGRKCLGCHCLRINRARGIGEA